MARSDSEPQRSNWTAAQYVRMSTDMQKYSTENQIAAIAIYAARHGIEIVKTYVDAGKSGLTIKHRPGLQHLIEDVRSAKPSFNTILVYDISRWGRFQDADESAYYEFICRESGISIRYCAEEFENDGSLGATIIKAIKRAMAAEYSRELSNRVFSGKCRMTMRGFHAGGRPGYGLRRMLVDEHGAPKLVLEDRQRKFLHTDRVVLVPGPEHEIETVRWIFEQYAKNMPIATIVSDLNDRGIPGFLGKPWIKNSVREVLRNERYIGNNVFNRTSVRLKSQRVQIPRDQWVRAKGVIPPIVKEELFDTAQERISQNLHRITRFELLDHLTGLWCRHGRLSAWLVDHSPTCASANTYARLFGSLLEAFQILGYPHGSRRPIYGSVRQQIADTIIAEVKAGGGTALQMSRRRQTRLLVNSEVVISIFVAHRRYATRDDRPRWILSTSVPHRSDIAVLATFDQKRLTVLDYYIVPGFLLTNPQQILFDINPIEFEAFRSSGLSSLAKLLERKPIVSGNCRRPLPIPPIRGAKLRILRFNVANRPIGSARVLRGFQRGSRRVVSFVTRWNAFNECHRSLTNDLIFLLNDDEFCQVLESEGLHTMPATLRRALWPDEADSYHQADTQKPANQPRALGNCSVFPAFRSLCPERLQQIEQMRTAFCDQFPLFARLLIAASTAQELIATPPASRIMSPREIATIQHRFRPVENVARAILPIFATRAYCFAFTRAYFRGMLSNGHVAGYIRAIHPKIHRRLKSAELGLQ